MAVTIMDANAYFNENVLYFDEWKDSDDAVRQRALNNAKAQLYRFYKSYREDKKPLPDIAVYEQALWLLRQDESIRRAELGVSSFFVKGLGASTGKAQLIAPEVLHILGRRTGRQVF